MIIKLGMYIVESNSNNLFDKLHHKQNHLKNLPLLSLLFMKYWFIWIFAYLLINLILNVILDWSSYRYKKFHITWPPRRKPIFFCNACTVFTWNSLMLMIHDYIYIYWQSYIWNFILEMYYHINIYIMNVYGTIDIFDF